MGDHLIEEKLVRRLLGSETLGECLCVDYTPAQHHKIEAATKVAVNITGYIKNIGKELDLWNALDTGVFLITDDFFKAVDEVVQSCGTDIETADVVRFLIGRGHCFHTCDVSGCFWIDVDTPKDLGLVRSL